MLYNWIKGIIKPKYFKDSYYYRLEKQRYKADLNYVDTRWCNPEFRIFK
ncbi:MAG: hypothetical protein GX053_07150 [Tissierella sp.]|nr:hypothetical protein [Tissierella sp.]